MNRLNVQYVVGALAVWCFFVPGAYAAMIIGVPFTSQAPFQSWKLPYEEFCEEASVVMAAHFLWRAPITPAIADLEMKLIKTYEELRFGYYEDTSAEETALVLRELYGFSSQGGSTSGGKNITVREVARISDIKNELGAGRIILAPVAGRILQNPYFTPPGPTYHMVVIYGFDDSRGVFITHDPGTRRGNGFVYPQARLFNAIHDLNGGDVLNGKKMVIVVAR